MRCSMITISAHFHIVHCVLGIVCRENILRHANDNNIIIIKRMKLILRTLYFGIFCKYLRSDAFLLFLFLI